MSLAVPYVGEENAVLPVLRIRACLFPEDPSMTMDDLKDATGLIRGRLMYFLGMLAGWAEVFSPAPERWQAVDAFHEG